ncbi:MAG TPA: hypothetical protein VM434_09170 [Beijerinckiaceae bacterium]|nr:hypothetical protein [Beijerinckiaceae bacterium]
MQFSFEPRRTRGSRSAEHPTFRVGRLWTRSAGGDTEVSEMIDRTYAWSSLRELRWYLADRFGHPVAAVVLNRV